MKKLLTILFLIMLIISFFQITSMYALYREQLESDYSALLGVWSIKVNEADISSGEQNLVFNIGDDQLQYADSEYIQAGKIAPGGRAYFDIVIDPTNTDVAIVYQLNLEHIDIPNAQMSLIGVENYFKKDGQTDIVNTEVYQDGNLYRAVMPVDKIVQGYKNHLKLNFKWVNEDTNSTTDSILADIENATNKNITWQTSDDTVATITNGVVTAIGAGTATITATTEDGSFTDTCTVTVLALDEGETLKTVSAVSTVIDKTQVTLKIGETEALIAKVYPHKVTNKNITWTSSEEEVATISNGVITAVSAGTSTITATTEDGSFTHTCAVTVSEDAVATEDILRVTGINLDKTAISLKVGETEKIETTIWSQTRTISIPLQLNLKQYIGEGIGNGS